MENFYFLSVCLNSPVGGELTWKIFIFCRAKVDGKNKCSPIGVSSVFLSFPIRQRMYFLVGFCISLSSPFDKKMILNLSTTNFSVGGQPTRQITNRQENSLPDRKTFIPCRARPVGVFLSGPRQKKIKALSVTDRKSLVSSSALDTSRLFSSRTWAWQATSVI
jgi:hypothetical protein